METPVSLGGSSGATGIGVVPSDLSSTTMQQVFTGAVTPIGVLGNFTLSGSVLTTYSPYAGVYEAADGSGLTQLYGLALADSSDTTPPIPGQIGALSQTNVCYGNYHVGNTNLLQPTSAFFILQYAAPAGSCNAPTTVLMHWSDSSSTAPTPVPAITANTPSGNYADLYTFPTGQLYAEVLLTTVDGGDLNIYPAGAGGTPNFSSPRTVATGAQSVDHHAISLNRSGQASSTVLFSNVAVSGKYTLYRIDTLGGATAVYSTTAAAGTTHALQLSPTVVDNTYIYFIDITYTTLTGGQPGPPITYNFFREPLDGSSAPVQIGTATEASSGPTDGISYGLVDSDGTYLIVASTNLITNTKIIPPLYQTFGLYTLSVAGASNQSPSSLLQYTAADANGIVAFLDYASDHLFVNEISSTTTTALVFTPSSATPVRGPLSSTSFMQWAPTAVGGNHTVLQLQNLPTDGTQGGATLFNMSTDTPFATTQFTVNGITSFFAVSPQNNVIVFPVSNTIGLGYSLGASDMGLAIDVTKNQINTITVPNTNVSPF